MVEPLLINHVWLAVAIWVISYTADYYATIYTARLYQARARMFFTFGGSLELTPYYQRDVDQLRRWSPRFGLALLLSVIGIVLVWWLSVGWLSQPDIFLFLMGALVLREAAVLLRHARNITLFRYARDTDGLTGQVSYARWLVLKLSAIELISFALLFCLLFLLAGRWFFLGGGVACLTTGYQQWRLARKTDSPA